ncbi:putative pre-mrna splicing factor [Phaeomoniella chlamydospora]|uniref:U4/U6 snRNA-associated-splicing factor PRP24 n=1 Tax=Phaeomoniella chlamydospora TaxID=158046 RepID=A0A0G2G4M8_PHACM|nr:putative pre-mrna splicing factor [Phaeomoniella chlamydospora]
MRTDFLNSSLSPARQEKATSLALLLRESPYAYESHAELVKLLHDGFMDHVYPPDSPEANGEPHAYDLLPDLRNARANMDKLFAIGEDLWAEWIQDESMLARTVEERLNVMELCSKATQEEYGSTRLWITFGDWVLYSYNLVQGLSSPGSSADLSEEDLLVGREVFTWQLILDTWSKGAQETMWRINDSHVVWNRYIDITLQDLSRAPTPEGIMHVKTLFDNRLQTPHANWDSTFQIFSNFITNYMEQQYESIMVSTTQNCRNAKTKFDQREEFEANIAKVQESGDRVVEYNLWVQYIEWDSTPMKKKQTSFDLTNALYERAELRFPADKDLWEEHVIMVIKAKKPSLPLLARATRHCPWSGSLWSHYLLASEKQEHSHSETEEIKHKATNTGVLDVGGMEEVVKVHAAWCNYLRRRAFQVGALDEDLDVAEMGIRSSIETIQELGVKKYGKDYQGDPHSRLERVYVRFLSESGSWDSARETFRGLVKTRGSSWEFWMWWYSWEMMCWAKFIHGEHAPVDESRRTAAPHYATAVLKQGMEHYNVDWPERLMQNYISHCEDHEDAETVQQAFADVRACEKIVGKRRQEEAAEALAAETKMEPEAAPEAAEPGLSINGVHTGKRKRDDETQVEEEPSKKTRADEPTAPNEEAQNAPAKQLKRDRENSTILVENLPANVSEIKVRQFFRDCGVINTLKIISRNANEATAIIEFDEHEAALAAQTKNLRDFEEHTISIQLGSGSTVFVTNFPPEADENYIRDLFSKYGNIVDIRFPSLKYNTHRRFCYVQFRLNSEAQAATELDGYLTGDNLKLVSKVSNPLNKQERTGPMEEGREIYVRNIDWGLSESDLASIFQKYGTVESVRIPRGVGNKSKGFGYLVFSSKEEATAALEMNEQTIKARQIHVEISSKTGAKRQATNIITRVDRTKSPSMDRAGDISPGSQSVDMHLSDGHHKSGDRRARTLGLMNIPDTVNDSRIRAIAEPYGTLVKIVLRPDHQGAIVEYLDTSDAGKASLGLEGREIVPGRKIHIGTVSEMLKQNAEKKVDKILVGKQRKGGEHSSTPNMMNPGPIKRPGQTGKRGGLGMKRGGGFTGSASSTRAELPTKGTNGTSTSAAGGAGAGKSNNDFRALLQKGE